MDTVDFSAMIVVYNFVIGVLLVLSSDKIASLAGNVSGRFAAPVSRYAYVSVFTFGTVVAALFGSIYLVVEVAMRVSD